MDNKLFKNLASLSWQSVMYGAGIFGRQIVVYLALPLFTRFMPQEEFGVVSVVASSLAFLNTLTNAGLPSATFRMYNDTDDPNIQDIALGTSQVLILILSLLMATVVIVFSEPISMLLFNDSSYQSIILMAGILLFIERMIYFGNLILRIQVRPLASSLHSMFLIIVQLGISLVLVTYYNLGADGYWAGHILGGLLGLLLMAYLIRKQLKFRVSKNMTNQLLGYGIPLLPTALSVWALRLVDRALVANWAGLREVAVYEVGAKVGRISGIFLAAFNAAWPQFAFSSMRKENAKRIYSSVLILIFSTTFFAALSVTIFSAEIVRLMAPADYEDAVSVIFWIAASQVFWGIYPIMSVGLKIVKRTDLISIVAVSSAVINIVLNILMIPTIGIIGAAIANLVGRMILSFGTYLLGNRYYSFPIDWGKIFKIILSGIVVYLLYLIIQEVDLTSTVYLFFRMVILLVFPALFLGFRIVPREQYVNAKDWFLEQLQIRVG
jgi:O-antigen/teichoic acid export membrane protein